MDAMYVPCSEVNTSYSRRGERVKYTRTIYPGQVYSFALADDASGSLTCTITLPHVFRFSMASRPSARRSSGNVSGYVIGFASPEEKRLRRSQL